MTSDDPRLEDVAAPGTACWDFTYGAGEVCELYEHLDATFEAIDALADRMKIWGDGILDNLEHYGDCQIPLKKAYRVLGLYGRRFDRKTMVSAIRIQPKPELLGKKIPQPTFWTDLLTVINELLDSGLSGHLPNPGKLTLPTRVTMVRFGDLLSRLRAFHEAICWPSAPIDVVHRADTNQRGSDEGLMVDDGDPSPLVSKTEQFDPGPPVPPKQPFICTQEALGKFFGLGNRAKLMDAMQRAGHVESFKPTEAKGFSVVLVDPIRHAEAYEFFKPKLRTTPRRRQGRSSS